MNIICDLDGTIALEDHRVHLFREVKDYKAYYEACDKDEPNAAVIEIMRSLQHDYTIYIFSGRVHSTLAKTLSWLKDNDVPFNRLQMLNDDNAHRMNDHNFKLEWASMFELTPQNTLFVMEDRQIMVDGWRAAGFRCFQVAPGDF